MYASERTGGPLGYTLSNHWICQYILLSINADLQIKRFETMTEEWLDFIVACRHGETHDYDLVDGPMANDTIFNYVQDFIDGTISREAFWALAKFKRPTHQICFHTQKALDTLTFEGYEIHGN